jgi:predicted nucleic acid-binding protein
MADEGLIRPAERKGPTPAPRWRPLDKERVPEILKRLESDRAFWTLVGVSSEVLADAETLVAAHPLRTLDAIHIASAQLFATRITAPKLIFVSADARQATAAAAVGLTTRQVRSDAPSSR